MERQVKHLATGRKSWLFCDTVAGAEAAAAFFTLLVTAKENGLNPYDWLCGALTRLPAGADPADLLPFRQ